MLVSGMLVIGWVDEVDEGPDLSTTLEDAQYFSAWVVSSLPCKEFGNSGVADTARGTNSTWKDGKGSEALHPARCTVVEGRGGAQQSQGRERHQTKVRRQISLRPVESLHGVA